MNHYFSSNPDVNSNVKEYEVNVLGEKFLFLTDNGVFSKEHLDFGSKLLIESFVNPDTEGEMIDLGSGIGVMGIILSKKWGRCVTLMEINERAAKLSEKNVKNNNVNANVINKSVCDGIEKKYAVVVTNPPIRAGKKVVFSFFEEAYKCLEKDGELWVVIRKQQGAESAIKELVRLFENATIIKKKNGFDIIKAVKM